jgi:hypothetical protein
MPFRFVVINSKSQKGTTGIEIQEFEWEEGRVWTGEKRGHHPFYTFLANLVCGISLSFESYGNFLGEICCHKRATGLGDETISRDP